jgi:hypothetical protein
MLGHNTDRRREGEQKLELEQIRVSPFIRFLKNLRDSVPAAGLIGVEIGVFKAAHAEAIMENLNIQKLYLIDPYPENGVDLLISEDIPAAKGFALKRMECFGDKIRWLYVDGDEGMDRLLDSGIQADFVYIDGLHDKDSVASNILHAFPLVKEGGFIAGHDYLMREDPPIGVQEAVDAYIAEMGFRLHVDGRPIPDWWFMKDTSRWLRKQIRSIATDLSGIGLAKAATAVLKKYEAKEMTLEEVFIKLLMLSRNY